MSKPKHKANPRGNGYQVIRLEREVSALRSKNEKLQQRLRALGGEV